MKKKTFVLDTNVILHDYKCIYNFDEHDVVIPITVLEEIDNFKKGHDQINYNAREFIRILDSLSGEKLVKSGVKITEDSGKISINIEDLRDSRVQSTFLDNKADHRILSVAIALTDKIKGEVVLVSKDVNLRLKAKSLGVVSQDYVSDKIRNIDRLYSGKRIIDDLDKEFYDQLMSDESCFVAADAGLDDLEPHEYLIIRSKRLYSLGYYNPEDEQVYRITKSPAYGIVPRNAEQIFALHALMNPNIHLVTLSGKAGTGKTLMALAAALEVKKDFNQIFLARPVIPLSNRDMGFLPGDIEKKLDPYMQPLFDNLNVIKNQFGTTAKEFKNIKKMLESEKLHISPLSYIRGRSLDKIFFIIDETQNLTPHEIKTIITRAGEGTKIVLAGDPYQIDTPYLDAKSTGLTYLINRMRGQSVFAHITLEKGERSALAELASDLL